MKKPIFLPMPPELKVIILFLLMWVVIFGLCFLSAICTGCASTNYTAHNDSVIHETWRESKDIPDSTKQKLIYVFGVN